MARRSAVAADHRVVHVHPHVVGLQHREARQHDAARHQLRLELPVAHHHVGHRFGDLLQVVVFGVQEAQHAALEFLGDLHLDPVDPRQALAFQRGGDRPVFRIVSRGSVEHGRRIRVGQQDDAVAALPVADHEGAGADRVVAGLAGIGLDHLARHDAGGGGGEVEQEVVVRRVQADAQGVAVGRLQAGHRDLVAEALAQGLVAGDLALEHIGPGRLERGVVQALDAVDVVLGRHLAPRALEGRVRREQDAGADAEGIGQPVRAHLGHGGGRVRAQPGRARQVVVAQQGIEQVFQQRQGGVVGSGRRVQPGFAGGQEHAQDLLFSPRR